MLRIDRRAVVLIAGFVMASCWGATSETEAGPTVRMNPYRTSDDITPDDLPAIGYRYANLGGRERQSLRRSFKLPMEALGTAHSINDLRSAAIVQPLPDPSQPFLPVSVATDATGDPFADSGTDSTANALGALGRLFAKEEALRGGGASDSSSPEYPPSATSSAADDSDPLASEDPFADDVVSDEASEGASSEPEPQEEPADPFGSDEDDDFGDDPFGDF